MFEYTNNNTGDVRRLPQRSPRLDALPNWRCVELPDDPDGDAAAKAALDRAAGERASIEAAQASRAQASIRHNEEAAQIAAASAQPVPGSQPNVTASHIAPVDGSNPPGGVLARGKTVTQLSREQLEAKAAADAREADKSGVLARAKADQRSGALQVHRTKPDDDSGAGQAPPPAEPKLAAAKPVEAEQAPTESAPAAEVKPTEAAPAKAAKKAPAKKAAKSG